MSPLDIAAAVIFIASWLVYEPLLMRMTSGKGVIKADMRVVREAWLRRMLVRENRIADSNLLGHQLSNATFFASTNLLLIAAAAGLLFGGQNMLDSVRGLIITQAAPDWLIEVKIAVVVATLTIGFLHFVWSIRQLNYSLALFGAAPERNEIERHDGYVRAVSQVLDPAYASFNRGMRSYYFSLAAAAWLVSPYAMIAASLASLLLLLRRQTGSEAAQGVREARRILEAAQRRPD